MSTEQNITSQSNTMKTVPDVSFGEKWSAFWSKVGEGGKLIGMTGLALVFIINGVAVGLYCFGLVHPSQGVAAIFGALSFSFAAYALGAMVFNGVKWQLSSNKKRR